MHGPGLPGRHPRPTGPDVLRRALALASVAARAGLETRAGDADAAMEHRRLAGWLAQTGLDAALEPGEAVFIATPPGGLDPQAVVDASWRAEGAYVLAWALGRHDAVAHDRLMEPAATAAALGFLADDALAGADVAELRGEREIDGFLARQLAVHWRLREYALRPVAIDFAAAVAQCDWAVLEIDACDLADGDLAIGGRAIADADAGQLARCTSIAGERHRAANWLAGADPLYSNVETIT